MENFLFLNIFFILFLGAIFGSFLNVLIAELEPLVFLTKEEREKRGIKSFWKRINRRSQCPHCGHKLGAMELIPIFSWLVLGAKCKKCKAKISARYFLMEIFSALTFLGFAYHFYTLAGLKVLAFNWLEFYFLIPLISALIIIFLFDLKHKIIPDLVIIPSIIYALIYISFDFNSLSFNFSYWLDDIWRSILFALPFFALWLLSRGRAMGFADWKLVFLLSLFLNNSMENLLFIFGSFWLGAIYAIPALIFKKSKLKAEIPFGPFIILSFLIVYFFHLSYLDFVNFLTF